MTAYHKTIPSAVLGEYLADVYRFELAANTRSEKQAGILAPCWEKGQGLGPSFGWLGEAGQQVADGYWRVLAHRARRSATLNLRPLSPFRRSVPREVEATAPKVEAVKVDKPKPKPKRNDAAYNERRMRVALLELANPKSGWVKAGIRETARRAGMPHRTARTVLDRMAADGQVVLDRKWGQGNPTGVHPLLEHPAWSQHEYAQLGPKAL